MNSDMLYAKNFISKDYTYAVIGASNNPDKYGYKVFANLKEGGYNIIPVNLKEEYIQGIKAYSSVKDIPVRVNVAVFITPPEATEQVVIDVYEAGIKKVWMQPRSESEKAINFCISNGIQCVYNECIMVERRKLGL